MTSEHGRAPWSRPALSAHQIERLAELGPVREIVPARQDVVDLQEADGHRAGEVVAEPQASTPPSAGLPAISASTLAIDLAPSGSSRISARAQATVAASWSAW